MPAKITKVSALVPLVDFMEAYGRPPSSKECRPQNGLCHYSTYVRGFETLTAAVSAALELDFSCMQISAVSNLRGPQERHCLQCGQPIRDQGPAIRHCRLCRKRLFQAERNGIEPEGELPYHISRFLHKETWDDLLEDATLLCH